MSTFHQNPFVDMFQRCAKATGINRRSSQIQYLRRAMSIVQFNAFIYLLEKEFNCAIQ